METWTKDTARKFTIDYLKSKLFRGVVLKDINMFGHSYITTEKGNFYMLYKHDQFHSFQYEFKEYMKKKNAIGGLGESINAEYLEKAIRKKCTLLFTYQRQPNAIYTPSKRKLLEILERELPNQDFKKRTSTELLKIFCVYYNLIRVQDRQNTFKANDYSGSPIVVNEETFSFPFAITERFFN